MPDLYTEKNLVIIYKTELHSICFMKCGRPHSGGGGGSGQIGCMWTEEGGSKT